MIQTVLKIVVSPETRAEAIEIINSIIERIRVSSGCISYGAYEDVLGENSLMIVEEWQSRADLDRFICSDEYRYILALIELAKKSPEIHFYTLSKIGGMEVIESLRKATSF
ncbi:MAG: antibiotic biosynthesis monooxygenase [Deltaproteobacteria bacterium]|nr:antibiotic biosynthesis monooxygenase [Deltaproteobacteria bacterium]